MTFPEDPSLSVRYPLVTRHLSVSSQMLTTYSSSGVGMRRVIGS